MNIDDMVARFARASEAAKARSPQGQDRLHDISGFGTNPGSLRGRVYVPKTLPPHPALVVVLHGCTQTAAGYDHGSGWSTLADRFGFVLLYPEQQRANNPSCCFNWFSPEDARRDHGEAESIRQMVDHVVTLHRVDRSRIFVTGLSAGGAMASVMLATHPELFAGGAIIAGLPYGTASSVPEAFERMRGQGALDAADLTASVRRASRHSGAWPTLSIWHGSADATVSPTNAGAILEQWRTLHGATAEPDRIEMVSGYPRRVWCNASGREVIEDFSITGMGHGTPLAPGTTDGCGAAGAFMLDARISSTFHIAKFWGLVEAGDAAAATPDDRPHGAQLPALASIRAERIYPNEPSHHPQPHVQAVIEKALRAAGLMK